MLKRLAIAATTLTAAYALSVKDDSATAEEQARFGFVSVNSDGSLSMTYNQTSLQYTLLIGLVVLVVAAILLPLLGLIGLDKDKYEEGAFDDENDRYGGTYKRRSIGYLDSIMTMFTNAIEKYGGSNTETEKENE